ncbi:uncharacterized protein P884DRAFT_239590 [Thermothelomyces heterothallicus CBS 202.75]|uniref:uncharacterized protein n=1 Tax=Thermothelomyces heterothallicus CBS 202.75 TaxID=1149848 RepID=UPI0037435F41
MFPPPQLQPIQPTPAPQFAPQAAHVPPHFLVMQPGQQAQQVPIMQPQQQQQQQQQPLMWKANTGRDPYPRFPAPHRNPNQSFMPPPDVMQSIRKQDLRLQQPSHVQNPSRGQGQGQALPPLDAATHGGSSQGASEEVKVANDKTAVASAAVKSGHEEKASGWRKTNGGVSSSEYDGSGWGDEEEGQS